MKTREHYLIRAQRARRGLQRVAALTRRARAFVKTSNGSPEEEGEVPHLAEIDGLYLALADLGGPYPARAAVVGVELEGTILPDDTLK